MSRPFSHIHSLPKFIVIYSSIFLAYFHLADSIDILYVSHVLCPVSHTARELSVQNQTSLLHDVIYLLVTNIKKLSYTPIKKYLQVNDWRIHKTSLKAYCTVLNTFFPLWRCGPTRAMTSLFFRFLDHIQQRTIIGRTSLDEWSARRRDLYLTTLNTDIPCPRRDSKPRSQQASGRRPTP
jgi:hypothetical protein